MWHYAQLIAVYLLCVASVGFLFVRTYQAEQHSFHHLFSAIYVVTFFLGFPFSMALSLGFGYELPSTSSLMYALVTSTLGYGIYLTAYHLPFLNKQAVRYAKKNAKNQAYLTACFLALVALVALLIFGISNGFLLFRLEKYQQIFSSAVNLTFLKRFFYFLLPALLIWFFLSPSQQRWWGFLAISLLFGTLSYIIVGGTRSNLGLALCFFCLLGLYKGYLRRRWLVGLAILGVAAMFGLALLRYRLNVSGSEAVQTFLYLTRDTFSPWENVAKLFDAKIEYQGLMPIVREFYTYIPQAIWQEKPNLILNSGNYFTWEVLHYHAGVAISPTLLGSFYIMGGVPLMGLGMAAVGLIIRCFDISFERANLSQNPILQAYCLGNLFNFIVLIRDGADSFFSRWLFFSVIFGICWLLAKAICSRK